MKMNEGQAILVLEEAADEHFKDCTEFQEAVRLASKALRRDNKYRKKYKRFKRKYLSLKQATQSEL